VKSGAASQSNGIKTRKKLPGLAVKDGLTQHPFDEEFGMRTSGLVAGRNLKSDHRNARHVTAYFGVAPSVLTRLISRWRKLDPVTPISATTFVDLGAGMGRAVLLASAFPFKAVYGVELHETLVRIARKNVRAWQASGRGKSPIWIAHGDAVEFAMPAGPALVFLFNPFGAPVLRRLLKKWRSERMTQPLDLIYVNNEQEHVLQSDPGCRRLFAGKVPRSKADAIADHAIMANQPDGEYTSANHEDCSIWRFINSGNR
jgi:SAM-dependent methyltransferase